MGASKKSQKGKPTGLDIFSDQFCLGRRLTLRFLGANPPKFDRIEFRGRDGEKFEYLQYANSSDPERSFIKSRVADALAAFTLDSLAGRLQKPPCKLVWEKTGNRHASALLNAFRQTQGAWFYLFTELGEKNEKFRRVENVFGGIAQDKIFIQWDYLAADCIEIYLDGRLSVATSPLPSTFIAGMVALPVINWTHC